MFFIDFGVEIEVHQQSERLMDRVHSDEWNGMYKGIERAQVARSFTVCF